MSITAKSKPASKKTASKKAPAAPKGEPKTVEINPAVLASESQQRWKKRNGYCLVKGCREKADKGHFCSAHASARSRLKAKGEKLEDPIDFTPKPRGPKAGESKKPAASAKKAPAKKSVSGGAKKPAASAKKAPAKKSVSGGAKKPAKPKAEPTSAPTPVAPEQLAAAAPVETSPDASLL